MSKTTNYELEKYDDNTNCDFRFINGSLDKIDIELKNVSDKANTKDNIIKNITISKDNWTRIHFGDPLDTWYAYYYHDKDIKKEDVVDINFTSRDTALGNTEGILPCTSAENGSVWIYKKTELQIDLTATMIIHKGAI
ncbi:hypothetical protein [Clostridium ihumii]|uniref:hypothetical protein n=1 Tax=Clostridium ihumii TaxID=1470356 RepID=UPI0005527D41|nr:hypothetical protein [Clostridium ihumii]